MSGTSFDFKANLGLANSLSNVFKLADVNGLKWVRYTGPNSSSLEAPKDDPVLNSYAKLLNEGYACSWRRFSSATDGVSGEVKDLWVFYFTSLPDISDKLAEGLHEEGGGSWEDGMTTESSTMLYRSLHNIIERSLLSENFLPLGKWFARPDSSVATDGSSCGCFLCSFSFFVHAHLYICASVDMRAGPNLQPLLPSHINQALASSTGLQVILSPSGLNAVMTGHSYKGSDAGIDDILDEWKLFFQRRFTLDPSPGLPAAIEVILGGVRMRYPSQFVFIYHGGEGELSNPPPPSSSAATLLEGRSTEELMQETWDTCSCSDAVQQHKDLMQCRCQEIASSKSVGIGSFLDSFLVSFPDCSLRTTRSLGTGLHSKWRRDSLGKDHSHRRLSSTLDLPLKSDTLRQSRYEPYPTSGGSRRSRELATPAVNLGSTPVLTIKKKLSRVDRLPRYTTPLSSPALLPSSSPTPMKPPTLPLPAISVNIVSNASFGGHHSYSVCEKSYDQARVPNLDSGAGEKAQQFVSSSEGWWDCLALPDNLQALIRLQPLRVEKDSVRLAQVQYSRREGLSSQGGVSSPLWNATSSQSALGALLSPTSQKAGSPGRRVRNSIDHASIPPISAIPPTATPSIPLKAERPTTPNRRPSLPKTPVSAAKGRGTKGNNAGIAIGSVDKILANEVDAFESSISSPMSMDGDLANTIMQTDLLSLIGGSDPTGSLMASREDGPGGTKVSADSMERFPMKAQTIDVFSESAVKIEDGVLDQIFASDEEDEEQESEESTHFPFGSVLDSGREEEKMETTIIKQHAKPLDPIELSRIYPTPPSVETSDEKFEENRLALEERGEHAALWERSSSYLDEEVVCVPPDFSPLPNITCFRLRLPRQCIYTPPTPASAGGGSEVQVSRTSTSSKSEPKKFIFPPPSMLNTRAKIESLTLPLTTQPHSRISPHHIFTPQLLTSSPAFPPRGPNRFFRHLSSASATPLESPFDMTVTPTPLSATTNRLMPVLPEAHALYINLSLLDSALGANLSETLSINTGHLMSTLRAISTMRRKLDSVDSMSALENPSSTTNLPNLKEEKPIMTFGIADYPSLGFREELVGVMGASTPSTLGSWAAPYGSLSKFVDLIAEQDSSDHDTASSSFPLFKFLEQLQDHCLHLCFTGCHDKQTLYNTLRERSKHAHLMVRSSEHAGGQEDLSGRLYHSHSVLSAVVNAKHLVVSAGKKMATPVNTKPSPVTLSKEDNSAAWILELLTLPTKFIMKRLKELRSVFQSSFHHAPCLRFSTKGPLTLKDLQQLTPSQTALGDECSPLPMQPVVVGYDHEWLAVSPLALPAWEKLLFEPYAMQKNAVYLVFTPSSSPSLTPTLRRYFRDLSIVFKNCNLGHHLPLEKGIGEGAIIMAPPPESSSTEDPQTNTRHGIPAGLTDMAKLWKKILAPYLRDLPECSTELITSQVSNNDYTLPSSTNRPTPPLSIILYVVCRGGESNTQECFQIMHTFSSEVLSCEEIPLKTKERLVLQLVDSREIFGQNTGHSSQLQSLAFSVYTRCRPTLHFTDRARTLTSFGPTVDNLEHSKLFPCRRLFAPPFVLSPHVPLASTGPVIGTQTHHILFNPEEAVLFCGYCVSPDQRWLLVVCCDRQGELLDTSIIGIQHPDIDSSRFVALQKLWTYILSIVAGSVLKWNIVITRFGKPSNSEIRDWPNLMVDDGLLTANQLLTSDCSSDCFTCIHTTSRPHLTNVIMVSVQPERNIQLFPVHDPNPSVSHVMVLPPDPCSSTGPCMTPSATDTTGDDFEFGFAGVAATGDMAFPMDASLMGDLHSELSDINLGDELRDAPLGMAPGVEDTLPKATGYLISTSPPGDLPDEFWGHDKPQTLCSMFKVLLHCHRSEKAHADSPQETLGSILLCFDGLSWLMMDHNTRQRRSCLPLHLFTLSKMYHLFTLLEQSR